MQLILDNPTGIRAKEGNALTEKNAGQATARDGTGSVMLTDMLVFHAEKIPSRPAVIHENRIITYLELHRSAAALACYLVENGLAKGDRVVMIQDKKTPELIVSFLGIAAAGGIVVPIDSTQPLGHFNNLLRRIEPVAVILSPATKQLYDSTRLPMPPSRVIVTDLEEPVPGEDLPSVTPFSTVMNRPGKQELPRIRLESHEAVYFNLTSGTTGLPKCAVTSHETIYWNTRSAIEQLGLTADDVHLCMFPPATHPHELLARSIMLGGTAVLTNHLAPRSLTEVIVRNSVTAMMAVCPVYGSLQRFHQKTDETLSCLRIAESGGMHLDPVTAREFRQRFGISILPVWGSTETAGIALAAPLDGSQPSGSCGKPCRYYDIRVVDKHGNDMPAGETGELIIRGKGVCSGYFKNEKETRSSFRDGWYWTSDMFHRDDAGNFFFAGRKNGMMKVAGMKVFPVEIEDHLIEHPLIKEVGVTKVNDEVHGEIPKAVIVLEPGASLDKKEIRLYCRQKLAPYKIPKIIEFRDALPRTPSGKILSNRL